MGVPPKPPTRDPDGPAGPSLAATLVELSRRAGKPLWIPPDVAGLCCSTPWKSKAYHQGHTYMAQAVADALWEAVAESGFAPVTDDGLAFRLADLSDAQLAI